MARALDLILHGTVMNPHEALRLGIVNRVFPKELSEYREVVSKFVENLSTRAPRTRAHAKRAIREGMAMNLHDGLRREAELFGELMPTEDAANALSAAQHDSPRPEFKGR